MIWAGMIWAGVYSSRNILNFDSEKISVITPWDHLNNCPWSFEKGLLYVWMQESTDMSCSPGFVAYKTRPGVLYKQAKVALDSLLII